MTNLNKRVVAMLTRVLAFRASHQEAIGADTRINQLFEAVAEASRNLSALSAEQFSGKNNVRISSGERKAARESLHTQLDTLCRTSESMGLNQFFLPRDRTDIAIVAAAKTHLALAEPIANEFIANHMPVDFIDRLKTSIAWMDEAITHQQMSKGSRKRSTLAIAAAQREALAAVERLDPIVNNLLADDATLRETWDAASRLEKPPASRKSAKQKTATESAASPPQSQPPASETANAA